MNLSVKRLISIPKYNKKYPPCGLDICQCTITYNLQSSYIDRHKYKICYKNVERILSSSHKSVERLFDGEV